MSRNELLSPRLLRKAERDQAILDKRLRQWHEILDPYENDVDEFVREKGLDMVKWRMDDPRLMIRRPPEIDYRDDWGKIQWTIQFGYHERRKKLGLVATAYIDTEYDVSDGRVHERRLTDSPQKHLIANWKKGDQVNIRELLEKAYERATSFTLQDLTRVSASITTKRGDEYISTAYNPQSRSQA